MKSLIKAVAIAAVLAAPIASFAQSNQQPLTRAEVRDQLIQMEQAGYNPATSNDVNYPADAQAAERRVWWRNKRFIAVGCRGSAFIGPEVGLFRQLIFR
jgi:hypothetical protein